MDVIHRDERYERVLAAEVTVADGPLAQVIGRMGRSPLERGEAMVFRFSAPGARRVHSLFVRQPLDVIWVARERVIATATLPPWRIGPRYQADTVIECPAGGADGVTADDRIRLEPSGPDTFK